MKKNLIWILLIIFSSNNNAQKCVVYTMVGEVTVHTQNGTRPVRLRETLQPAAKITIPYNTALELFDQENRRKYVINTPGTATVKEFINDKRNNKIDLTSRIFEYMVKRITSKDNTFIQSCSDPAAVTRDVLKDTTIHVTPSDTLPDAQNK